MRIPLLILLFCGSSLTIFAQIHYQNVADEQDVGHSYGFGASGGGVSFYDFDGDGDDDITLGTENGKIMEFYRNNGTDFDKIPPPAFVVTETKQILWVDFDNDGDKDLFVTTRADRNYLFQNNDDIFFQDITEAAGLPVDTFDTYGAAFADYNRDGWLDLYFGKRLFPGTDNNRHFLFKNNADGTFSDVTDSSGVADPFKLQFCSGFFDLNNDKWPDLYTAHDKLKINSMFRNNGDGTFSDIGEQAGAALSMNAMCVTVGDYNNDGWQDIYVTNTPLGNALLKNNGDETFEEVAAATGTAFYSTGWASQFLDADNDGDLDLYVSGSTIGTTWPSSTFYENEGDGTFSEPDAGFWGDTLSSYNNAQGDFNDDGYPDIMVVNTAPFDSQLWMNGGGDNNWIKIKLEGVYSNRDGIGSLIEVFVEGQKQIQYTHCGYGFLGQNSATKIFGIGAAAQADSVRVTWPTGHIDRLFAVAAGTKLEVLEGSTTDGEIDIDPDITIVGIPKDTTNQDTTVMTQVIHHPALEAPIFPNPAQFSVTINVRDIQLIRVYDSEGFISYRKMFTQPQQQLELNISDWPAGFYLIYVEDKRGRIHLGKMAKP